MKKILLSVIITVVVVGCCEWLPAQMINDADNVKQPSCNSVNRSLLKKNQMEKNVSDCSVFYPESTEGTTYYIANNGNDSNDGRSKNTPWKTLSKISENSSFRGGDKILLKRGDIWHENIIIDFQNRQNNPITIGAYGDGNMPVIDGSELLSNWTRYGGNIWKCPYKNEGIWVVLESTDSTSWGIPAGSLDDIDADKEFYFDDDADTVYLYSPSDPAVRWQHVAITHETSCISSYPEYDASNVIIENLEIRYGLNDGIRLINDDNVVIRNNKVHHIYGFTDGDGQGIQLHGNNNYIGYNEVYECGQHGISIAHWNGISVSRNCTIEYNRVWNCYHTAIDIMNDGGVRNGIEHLKIIGNVVFDTKERTDNETDIGIQILGWDTDNPGSGIGTLNNITIAYNLSYNQNGIAFNLHQLTNNVKVYNNVAYGSWSAGFNFENSLAATYDIKNNISWTDHYWASVFFDAATTNYSCNYNIWYGGRETPIHTQTGGYKTLAQWQQTGFDVNSYSQNPNFMDTAHHDFRLQANSIARDNGVDLGMEKDADENIAGNDIGAYEYGSGNYICAGKNNFSILYMLLPAISSHLKKAPAKRQ